MKSKNSFKGKFYQQVPLLEHGSLQNGLNAEMSLEMLCSNVRKIFRAVGTTEGSS